MILGGHHFNQVIKHHHQQQDTLLCGLLRGCTQVPTPPPGSILDKYLLPEFNYEKPDKSEYKAFYKILMWTWDL